MKKIMNSNKIQRIKNACLFQNKQFNIWAKSNDWYTFHKQKFDWWAFPADINSQTYQDQYKVQAQGIQILIQDKQFIYALRDNAVLVCLSWGWNLFTSEQIKNPAYQYAQQWQSHPIRLSKMCRSLEIFNQKLLLRNLIQYAVMLLNQYKKFEYGMKDLTPYFYKQYQQINKNIEINKQNNDDYQYATMELIDKDKKLINLPKYGAQYLKQKQNNNINQKNANKKKIIKQPICPCM